MKTITMKAYKMDGWLHYESDLQMVEKRENLYILYGPINRTLTHYTREKVFTFDNQSIELYFNDRWYTVACVIDPQGEIQYYYCNIAQPCRLLEDEARFIDLDLDVIIEKDMSYKVIDQDEFEEHQVKYGYDSQLIQQVYQGVEKIIEDIEIRAFPFDGTIDSMIEKLGLRTVSSLSEGEPGR